MLKNKQKLNLRHIPDKLHLSHTVKLNLFYSNQLLLTRFPLWLEQKLANKLKTYLKFRRKKYFLKQTVQNL